MTTPPTPLLTMKGSAATNPRRNAEAVNGGRAGPELLMVKGIRRLEQPDVK